MPQDRAKAELSRMAESVQHEDFYRTGTWLNASLGVYVAWTALEGSSFSDGIPISDERGDVSLVFSGEDYRDTRAVDVLEARCRATSANPAAYLLRLYDKDPFFPSILNGRFHGVLSDQKQGTVTLFNDRWGMHRLYYWQSKDAFYFAAEAKAILTVRPELRRSNPRSIGELIACGCVLQNHTLFEDVKVLPPASAWIFRNGLLEVQKSYFRPSDWENQELLQPEPFYRELRDVFSRTLPLYFGGNEPIGMSVSGGLDTRIIMAWQKPLPGTLPCYSFGGAIRDCWDVILGGAVARACGQSHQVIEVGETFLSKFAHYAERSVFLTDGCAGVAHAPDLFVNERAKEIATVRMTGNYGGEVLRRVRAFKATKPIPSLYDGETIRYVREAHQTYAEAVQCHPLSFSVFRQAPWHHYGLLALEQTQLSMRSPYLDNDLIRTVFRAPDSACDNADVSMRLVAEGDPALMQIPTDRGLAGNRGTLRAVARRGMLALTAKAEYAFGDGMPPWLARIDHLAGAAPLERLFLGRHKFAHFRTWYRGALSQYVQEMLLDSRTLSRPYLNATAVRDVVRGHIRGTGNYTFAIHQLLSLELVHRLFVDGP